MARSEEPWYEVGSEDLSDDDGGSWALVSEDVDIVLLLAAPPSPTPLPRRTIWEIIAARMAGSAFDPRHVDPEQRKRNEVAVKKRFQFDPTKRYPYTSRCGCHQVVGYFNLYAQGKIGLFTEEGFPVYVKLRDLSDESIEYVLYKKLREPLRAKVEAQLRRDHNLERVEELKKIKDRLMRQELAATTAVQLGKKDNAKGERNPETGRDVSDSERKLIARCIYQLDEGKKKESLVLLQKHIPTLRVIDQRGLEIAIASLSKDVLLTLVASLEKAFAQATELLSGPSALNGYHRDHETPRDSENPSKGQTLPSTARRDMNPSRLPIKERTMNLGERSRKEVDKRRTICEANDWAADGLLKQARDSEATSDTENEAISCAKPGSDRSAETDDLDQTIGKRISVPTGQRKDAGYESNGPACTTPVAARTHASDSGIALTRPVAGGRAMPLGQSRTLSPPGKSSMVNDEKIRPRDEYRHKELVSGVPAPEPCAIDDLVESIDQVDLSHEDDEEGGGEKSPHESRAGWGIRG